MSDELQAAIESPREDDTYSAEFRLQLPSFNEAPVVYSNVAQASLGQHDLTLFFGWYATPPLAEKPTEPVPVPVRPLLSVSVPLGTVRALIRVLESQAAAWEAATGAKLPAPNPPQVAVDKEEES